MTDMTKRQAHFQAFGYEPLRMKPTHFASGFFIALTGQVYANELLNKVAVVRANKGLQGDYTVEKVLEQLQEKNLVPRTMTPANVELLRVQVNGVVNSDDAMYPAFRPYSPKGNDYTFISPRVLTNANRTDGFSGLFVFTVLNATASGRHVLDAGRELAEEPPGTLERLVEPLLVNEEPETLQLQERYERDFGVLDPARITTIATDMQVETEALKHLCDNMKGYSHYKKTRYYILGLLAWLMSYILKTSSPGESKTPLLFFDFMGKGGQIRSQSQTCYTRIREIVRGSYSEFSTSGQFDPDPVTAGIFSPKDRPEDTDFTFLAEHFSDLALRMGYAQPRASNVSRKHFDLHPDTLRVLMLSILDVDAGNTITLDDVCQRLDETWSIVVGALGGDFETLRKKDYSGFDEEDLRQNTTAFSRRLKSLNMAFEPSDGLVLCSTDIGKVL